MSNTSVFHTFTKYRTELALLLVSGSFSVMAQVPPVNDATKQPPKPAAHGPTLESAIEVATAAVDACADKDQRAGVSIVDAAGVLKVLLAADGTSERGVLSSTAKAITALHFKAPTSELHTKQNTDKALAAQIAANPGFNARPGGVLLKFNNEIIGAIGVGGAKTDEECALAAIDKIEAREK